MKRLVLVSLNTLYHTQYVNKKPLGLDEFAYQCCQYNFLVVFEKKNELSFMTEIHRIVNCCCHIMLPTFGEDIGYIIIIVTTYRPCKLP